jgi:hypothetical protein
LATQSQADLEQRIEAIERRLAAMERLFQTATGHDPNMAEDSAVVRAVITESPGLSQTGVCLAVRERFEDLSRSRVIEVLRHGAGRHWRVAAGAYNSLLYFPCEHAHDTHASNGDSRPDYALKTIGNAS